MIMAYDPSLGNIMPDPYRTVPPAKFIQIVSSHSGVTNHIHALDENGDVWQHRFLGNEKYAWVKMDMTRNPSQ